MGVGQSNRLSWVWRGEVGGRKVTAERRGDAVERSELGSLTQTKCL